MIDTQGNSSTEHYATKREAENRQKELTNSLFTGNYASRKAGRGGLSARLPSCGTSPKPFG